MTEMSFHLWPGWEIVRKIGEGGFGQVYEIQRRAGSYQERAALKVIRIPNNPMELQQLHMSGLGEEDTETYLRKYVEEIMGEIGLMQRFVGYSNIVSYEDYKIDKHEKDIGWDILIRMELLTPLPEYLSTHNLYEKDVVKLGIDISQALVICHGAGIIHRDIKPQNIFLNDRGLYKLGDFGISRAAPGSGSVLSFKGTVPYMAPETFAMRGTDSRSDIYSLALVLYRILNGGREPFLFTSSFTPMEQEDARRRRLAGEQLPKPANCSDALWHVLSIALSADPSGRYQSAADFQEALQNIYAAGRPNAEAMARTIPISDSGKAGYSGMGHRPAGGIDYAHKPDRRRKNRWALGAIGIAAAVLAACILALTIIPLTGNSGGESDGKAQETEETEVQAQDEPEVQEEVSEDTETHLSESEDELAEEQAVSDNLLTDDGQESGGTYSGGGAESLSMAEFVEYTVVCEDTEGNILSKETDSGIEGHAITVEAPEFSGYVPKNETESVVLSENEEANRITFIYETRGSIPASAMRFNGHSYYAYVSSDGPSFWEAVSLCENMGGYMAVINTDEENRALYDYVFHQLHYKSAYFGYTDDSSEGSWYWVGPDSSTYENFDEGEPDNQKHGEVTENFALFYHGDPPYRWNDGDFGPDPNGDVIFLIEWDW